MLQGDRQLILPVGLDDEATFDNFLTTDANRQLLTELQSLRRLPSGFDFLWLWGAPGSGRSHLLQALCHQASAANQSAVYIPLHEHEQFSPELLSGMEAVDLVCLDEVDAVAGYPDWEHALFNLYNRMLCGPVRLVITSASAPSTMKMALPDLASRLQTALIFQLHGLDDEGKGRALKLRARTLGFDLPDEVVRYLLDRHSREAGKLFAILGQLDTLSLQRRRRITVPLLKELLQAGSQ